MFPILAPTDAMPNPRFLAVVGKSSGAYRKMEPNVKVMPNFPIMESVTISGTRFTPDAENMYCIRYILLLNHI